MDTTMDLTKNPGLDLVKNKDNVAVFIYMENGIAYYSINHNGDSFVFPVNMFDSEDVGTADFQSSIKALTLMRYVRKAIDRGQLVAVCTLSHVTAGTLYYTVKLEGSKFLFPVEKREKGTNMVFVREMGIDKLAAYFTRAGIDGSLIKLT